MTRTDSTMPAADTRGILHPRRMAEHVAFHRVPAPEPLAGLVDWFWSVAWDLPEGEVHRQDVVSHPGVNLSVGPAPPPGAHPPPGPHPLSTKVNGVITRRSTRTLTSAGWTVAAKTTAGGFAAWFDQPVSRLTDLILTPAQVWQPCHPGLLGLAEQVDRARAGLDPTSAAEAAAEEIGGVLTTLLARADPARVAQAHEAAAAAALVEGDPQIQRVDQLAAAVGSTPRTLQRLFHSCVGVSPKWLIRRHRLLEAAERARDGVPLDWAAVAAELGYADQAHLTRDFRSAVGQPPAAYTARQVPGAG